MPTKCSKCNYWRGPNFRRFSETKDGETGNGPSNDSAAADCLNGSEFGVIDEAHRASYGEDQQWNSIAACCIQEVDDS